jgi:hypothetical protein
MYIRCNPDNTFLSRGGEWEGEAAFTNAQFFN